MKSLGSIVTSNATLEHMMYTLQSFHSRVCSSGWQVVLISKVRYPRYMRLASKPHSSIVSSTDKSCKITYNLKELSGPRTPRFAEMGVRIYMRQKKARKERLGFLGGR